MRRLLAVTMAVVAVVSGGDAQAADTPLAAFTRTKKLPGKVTIDFKNEFLKDVLTEISGQLEEQKRGPLKIDYEKGVSGNTRVTYAGKDVTVTDALDGILKQLDLGYYVVSNTTNRADGYIHILKGPNRGYEAGQEPKGATVAKLDPKKPDPKKTDPEMKKPDEPAKPETPKPAETKTPDAPAADPEDEKLAGAKLALAKQLIEAGKADAAKIQIKFILKKYPATKAAAEAKGLMEAGDK
ncbi:MAG: hypothetical protein ACRC7O_11400 [Fimbriiglobus sp.]